MIGTLYVRTDDDSRFLFVADSASRDRHPGHRDVWRLLVTGYEYSGGRGMIGTRGHLEFSMREPGDERPQPRRADQAPRLPEVA